MPLDVRAPASGPVPALSRALRPWRVRLLVHRRPVAALAVALTVWCGLRVVSPPPPDGLLVQVAARDLPAGVVLRAPDVTRVRFTRDSVPSALAEAPLGRTLASPLTRGEPVTDARLVSPGLGEHLDGRTGVPVRVPDADVVRLLRVGDRVDLTATDPRSGSHRRVAAAAVVLALPGDADAGTRGGPAGSGQGRLVLLGVRPEQADEVASASATDVLQVLWRQPDAN